MDKEAQDQQGRNGWGTGLPFASPVRRVRGWSRPACWRLRRGPTSLRGPFLSCQRPLPYSDPQRSLQGQERWEQNFPGAPPSSPAVGSTSGEVRGDQTLLLSPTPLPLLISLFTSSLTQQPVRLRVHLLPPTSGCSPHFSPCVLPPPTGLREALGAAHRPIPAALGFPAAVEVTLAICLLSACPAPRSCPRPSVLGSHP